MNILGISSFYHDSAACIVCDGKIVAAAQEERFTRVKNDESFPIHSIQYCLRQANLLVDDIDGVIFYDKPFLKLERQIETFLAFAPNGLLSFIKTFPVWAKEKIYQKQTIIKCLMNLGGEKDFWKDRLYFSEHHLSHAASCFYPSPFDSAAILTIDGVGEWATVSIGIGKGSNIEIIREIHFPHSIGLLYSAFTQYTGFKVNSGEYKMMGLAPYGNPIYVEIIKNNLIDLKEDGSFKLNLKYFNYCTGLSMINNKFYDLFGAPQRIAEGEITQFYMDIAASIQIVTEEIVINIAKNVKKITGESNLCMAGGVALNCVANGKLVEQNIFNNVWIQPASGDAGGAIGAALVGAYLIKNQVRAIKLPDSMNGSFLGPSFSQEEVEMVFNNLGAVYELLDEDILIERVAEAISKGSSVGWFQGRMEFGPRALGGRSILGDPRDVSTQKTLNLKVKYRESFRPFAPSILNEKMSEWYDSNVESPYMLLVSRIKHKFRNTNNNDSLSGVERVNEIRSLVPAVTHLDYSSRIQTIDRTRNSKFHKLIERFNEVTGCPMLVNTSFNVRGEPIVCSPEDAYRCFMATEIEILAIENILLYKKNQPIKNKIDYKSTYKLD